MKFDPMQMHGIIRYANRVRIKNEDLAQHSYSVAYYCFDIAAEFGIPDNIRNEAIAMAIVHDIGECFTSDLPHDIKYENPELKQLCDQLERKYVDKLPNIRDLWFNLEDNGDTIQRCMVKLGDSLSVRAYVDREISLGNETEEFEEISKSIDERIFICREKLRKAVDEYYGK